VTLHAPRTLPARSPRAPLRKRFCAQSAPSFAAKNDARFCKKTDEYNFKTDEIHTNYL
jgi:hypothetical protein